MKKYLLLLVVTVFCWEDFFGQGGVWTWMNGNNSPGQSGVYGVKGVPSITNTPANLYEAVQWKDKQGNFWIYGGISDSSGNQTSLSDLWKFDPSTYEWTWVFGKALYGEVVHFGIKGVADTANTPGTRAFGSLTWVDTSGNLWLYGGVALTFDSINGYIINGLPNDLWKYDIQTNIWTWVNGINVWTTAYLNYYPPDSTTPGSMIETNASWTDDNNNLWLFGGYGTNPSVNDAMWKYSIADDTWTLMKGTYTTDVSANYGTQGIASSTNTPGGRSVYSKWKDASGNFWIFGGIDDFNSFDTYSDLWKYDPITNEWTWVNGIPWLNDVGVYGAYCSPSQLRCPRSRFENRASWEDVYGNFWFFGGNDVHTSQRLCDLWTYNPYTNKWTLIDGISYSNITPNFGTRGIPSLTNKIGSRMGSVGWCDNNNKFWIFGGWGTSGFTTHNDMFQFDADTSCYHPIGILSMFTTVNNQICPGTCTSFLNLSINATSYRWSFPGATPDTSTSINPSNICFATPGSYDVQLIASNTNGSDTLLLPNYITVYTSPPPQSITQSGDTLFAIAGSASYQWYFNTNLINGATNYFYFAQASGDYNVVATDANGCEVEAVVFNVVAGIPSTVDSGLLTIFPNPVGDKITIQIPIAIGTQVTRGTTQEISVYNMIGEKMSIEIPSVVYQNQSSEINVQSLSPGSYYLEIKTSEKIFRSKFVKQ